MAEILKNGTHILRYFSAAIRQCSAKAQGKERSDWTGLTDDESSPTRH